MFKIDTYTCNKDTKILYFMNKNSKLGLAFDARRPIGSNIIHRCGIWGIAVIVHFQEKVLYP